MTLKSKDFVLGVTGGIACYKSLEIVRGIVKAGGGVSVVMTKSAMEFVQPLTFQTLSARPVATSLFSMQEESQIGHIKLGENADAMIIAPATANTIAKAANGIADDYLSTALLANTAPLFIAPAMNVNMWNHQAVQHNLEILKQRGAIIIPPDSGFQACGAYGQGRMAEVGKILTTLEEYMGRKPESYGSPLANISVLVTAGPTQEKIDAVRYLTNYSSGKMGYAIAKHCQKLGADVCLISGPTSISPPEKVRVINVKSAEEMYNAVMEYAASSQLIIKSAAVSDFRIEAPNPQKTKKTETLTLKLVKNKDILKDLGKKKTEKQFLVGFAAESQNVEDYARQKLKAKNLDLIVANNILQKDAGFDVDTNRVLLIDEESETNLPLLSKEEVAEQILNHILAHKKWTVT